MKTRYGDASYFFEAASGYSIAALLYRLTEQQKGPVAGLELIERLTHVSTGGLPIEGLNFIRDEENGAHFSTDVRIYNVAPKK